MPKLYPGGLALAPEVIGDRKDGQKHADTLFFFNSKALETGQVRSGQRAEKGWRMSHWGKKRKKHFPAFFVVSAINLTHLHVFS